MNYILDFRNWARIDEDAQNICTTEGIPEEIKEIKIKGVVGKADCSNWVWQSSSRPANHIKLLNIHWTTPKKIRLAISHDRPELNAGIESALGEKKYDTNPGDDFPNEVNYGADFFENEMEDLKSILNKLSGVGII